MISHLLIIAIVSLIMVGVLIYFYAENKKLRLGYLRKETGFIEAFDVHNKQIQLRNKGLNTYDFLNYNLSEALIIQPDINI